MMYPFMTLNDDTEITHSETLPGGRVRVYIETPDERGGFRSATCWLPDYRWEGVCGYTASEMSFLKRLVRNNAHLILDFATDGGDSGRHSFLGSVPTSSASGPTRAARWSRCTFTSPWVGRWRTQQSPG